MSGRFSKSEIDRLGERIRASERLTSADLRTLQNWRAQREPDLLTVRAALLELGFRPTARLKTNNTLVEKIRRQPDLRLSGVQDVAGCRVVIPGGRVAQDAAVQVILGRFPGSRVVDRRERPSFGYRAVHLIVRVDGWPVEVQVRTELQQAWAQTYEQLADVFGREVRYGGVPQVQWAGAHWSPARLLVPVLRRLAARWVQALQRLSDVIDIVELADAPEPQAEQIRRRLGRLLQLVLAAARLMDRSSR